MMYPRRSTLFALMIVAIGFRLAPYVLHNFGVSIDPGSTVYPWNFSPILPLCLFGAAFYRSRTTAWLAPLAIYGAGDLGIWLLTGRADWAIYGAQPVLYLSVAMVVACGFFLRGGHSWPRIAVTGLTSAIVFFAVSNFGVWAFGGALRYPLTMAGLIDCYVQAIPFFRNTCISMALFLPLLFSPVSLAGRLPAPVGRLAREQG